MKLEELINLTESADASSVEDAKHAAEMFNTEISKSFGDDFVVKARIANILGTTLVVDFYDKHAKVTRHNSPVNINFLMGLPKEGKTQDKFDIDLTTFSTELKNNGLKYRKISGTSPSDAVKKLISWFHKNKSVIMDTFNKHVKK